MPLQSSGQISMNDIRAELLNAGKTTNVSLRYIGGYEDANYVPFNQSSTNKPNLSSPYQISEWASYNHDAFVTCSTSYVVGPTLSTGRVYHMVKITGNAGQYVLLTINQKDNNQTYTSQVDVYLTYPFNNDGTISILPFATFIGGTGDSTQTLEYILNFTTEYFHIVITRITPINP